MHSIASSNKVFRRMKIVHTREKDLLFKPNLIVEIEFDRDF